jgi:hypothetical protein
MKLKNEDENDAIDGTSITCIIEDVSKDTDPIHT